jgi:hypothetical protein
MSMPVGVTIAFVPSLLKPDGMLSPISHLNRPTDDVCTQRKLRHEPVGGHPAI